MHAKWQRPVALTEWSLRRSQPAPQAVDEDEWQAAAYSHSVALLRNSSAEFWGAFWWRWSATPAGDPFALEWRPRLQAAFRAAAVKFDSHNTRTPPHTRVYSRGAVGALTGVGVTTPSMSPSAACSRASSLAPLRAPKPCADDIGEAAEDDE